LSPETSTFKLQTPGKFPEEYKLHSEHGESLKTFLYLSRKGRDNGFPYLFPKRRKVWIISHFLCLITYIKEKTDCTHY